MRASKKIKYFQINSCCYDPREGKLKEYRGDFASDQVHIQLIAHQGLLRT